MKQIFMITKSLPGLFLAVMLGLGLIACDFSNDPIDKLIGELKDSYSITREQAARKLGEMGEKAVKAVPALRKRLLDINTGVRKTAAETLGKIGPKAKSAIPDLSKRLFDKESSVRIKAAWSLGRMGAVALPELRSLLTSDYPHARYYAIQALMQIKGEGVKELQKALRDPSQKVRRAAVEALLQLGPTYLSFILPLLKDPQDNIRSHVAWRMSRLAPLVLKQRPKQVPAMVKALAEALKDSSYQVRMYASFTLSKFDEHALPAKEALIQASSDSEWYVRKNAINALGSMKQKALSALPAIASKILDETWDVKNEAARAMRRIDEPQAVKVLQPLLQNPKPSIRKFVVQTLGWMGKTSSPAAASIVKLLADPHQKVWRAAQMALKQIGSGSVSVLQSSLRSRNPFVQERALDVLAALGNRAASAKSSIKRLFRSRVWFVRLAAFHALGRVAPLPDAVVQAALIGLKSENSRKRTTSVRLLAGSGALSALAPLWDLSKKTRGTLQWQALEALGGLLALQSSQLSNELLQHLAEVRSNKTRRALGFALARSSIQDTSQLVSYVKQALDVRDKEFQETVAVFVSRLQPETKKMELLCELLESPYPSVLLQALTSLLLDAPHLVKNLSETLSQKRVIQPLSKLLQHRSSEVRARTVELLGSFGARSKSEVKTISSLLKDSSKVVRQEAAAALGWIGKDAQPQIPALIKATRDRDARVRRNAVFALSLMLKKAVQPLTTLLLNNHSPQHVNNTCLAFQRMWIPPKEERGVKESLKILLLDKKLPKDTLARIHETLRQLQAIEKKQVFWVDHPRSPTLEVYVPEIMFPPGP